MTAEAIAASQLLPVEAYTSADWYAREQQELFSRVWTFACMTEDLPAPGDFVCTQAGMHPLIVMRQSDGSLRAFHNVCRHRGARLLEGCGHADSHIQCFYHRWTYDLDGALTGVPGRNQHFADIDQEKLALHPASVVAWRNLVFVHPEPDAEPWEDWLAGLAEKLGPHDPEELVEIARVRYRTRANWKIVIENFIDGYHFSHLHSETLKDGDFGRQQWEPVGRHWTFYRPVHEGIDYSEGALPLIAGCPPDFGADADVLFPNLALYATATLWLTFHVIPVAADESLIEIRSRAMPEALGHGERRAEKPEHRWIDDVSGPLSAWFVPPPGAHPLESGDVMFEDLYACEAVQQGMNSPRFEVGPMARDLENALTFFQRNILDFVKT